MQRSVDDRPTTYGQLDGARRNNIVNLISFVRVGMKRQISNKYARGTNTIVVYLLDLNIERLLSESQSLDAGEERSKYLDESTRDEILSAIRREIAYLPPTAQVPSILTSIDVRPFLRQLIATELPRIPVVSYQELVPNLNIQPVARISLN